MIPTVPCSSRGGGHPDSNPPNFEVNEIIPYKYFDITDHNGLTVRFMFEPGPGFRFDGTGTIPPKYRYRPGTLHAHGCALPGTYGVTGCTNRYHPSMRDVADSLMHAIDSSNLDVTLMRGTGDEILNQRRGADRGPEP